MNSFFLIVGDFCQVSRFLLSHNLCWALPVHASFGDLALFQSHEEGNTTQYYISYIFSDQIKTLCDC